MLPCSLLSAPIRRASNARPYKSGHKKQPLRFLGAGGSVSKNADFAV